VAGGGAAVLQQHWRRGQQRNAHTLHYGRSAIVRDAVRSLPKHSADVKSINAGYAAGGTSGGLSAHCLQQVS